MVHLREGRVGEKRVGLLEVELEREPLRHFVLLVVVVVVVVVVVLRRILLGQRAGCDVQQVAERRLVAFLDDLLQRLVVAQRAQPKVWDARGRILVVVRAGVLAHGLGSHHVHLALDDLRALHVQGRVQLTVLRLERAALLQELLAQLVVLLLDLIQLADARLHHVVELLDEAAGLAGEAVELALERADQAGVTAELAERGHDVLLVHALGELRVRERGRSDPRTSRVASFLTAACTRGASRRPRPRQ